LKVLSNIIDKFWDLTKDTYPIIDSTLLLTIINIVESLSTLLLILLDIFNISPYVKILLFRFTKAVEL